MTRPRGTDARTWRVQTTVTEEQDAALRALARSESGVSVSELVQIFIRTRLDRFTDVEHAELVRKGRRMRKKEVGR
jgi:hypothetical protein